MNRCRVTMNGGDDDDAHLDSELSNSRKRRVRGFSSWKEIKQNCAGYDEVYGSFLLDLKEFAEVEVVEEDVDDPEYLMVLTNLKEHRNSYVLDKSIKHGVFSPIKYEVEDVHCNRVINRKSSRFVCDENVRKERNFVNRTQRPRTRGDSMKRKKSRPWSDFDVEEVRTSDSSEDTLSDLNISGLFDRRAKPAREKRTVGEVVKRRKLMSRTRNYVQEKRNLNVDDCPNLGAESSASGKMKKKQVRFDYSQEEPKTTKKNPIPPSSNYCREEKFQGVVDNSRLNPKTSSSQKNVIDEVYKLFMDNFKVHGDTCVYENGDKLVFFGFRSDRLPSDLRPAIEADSSKRPNTVAVGSSDRLSSDWPLSIAADSSKQPITAATPSKDHLPKNKCLAIKAGSRKQAITVAPVSSKQARRETVFGISSKAPSRKKKLPPLPLTVRVPTQNQSTQPSTPFVPAPKLTMTPSDKQLDKSLKVRVPPNMRKKLLEILSRPYSKQEHDQLWKEVNFRSAVLNHRDSRSGGSDRHGDMGRSLLDWNPDLKSEIDKVESDSLKVLNLLRMLSFYIQKLPCGNICKPWMDDSLKTILPGSS
ncbi:hypothetical protein RND81_02G072100 [Saponaria officinalis]